MTLLAQGRIPNDHYATPPDLIEQLVEKHLDMSKVSTFLEPCRAEGNISRVIEPLVDRADWYEIREGRDYLANPYRGMCYDLIATNPPFKIAESFLRISLTEAKTVAYLMRINFLGGRARVPFFQRWPVTHLRPTPERPVFVKVCKTKGCGAKYHLDYDGPCQLCNGKVQRGTDMTEYAWFIWDRGGVMKTHQPIYPL